MSDRGFQHNGPSFEGKREQKLLTMLKGGFGNQLFQLAFNDFLSTASSTPGFILSSNFGVLDSYQRVIDRRLVSGLGFEVMDHFDSAQARVIGDSILNLFPECLGESFSIDLSQIHTDTLILDGYFQDSRIISPSFLEKLRKYVFSIELESTDELKTLQMLTEGYSVNVHLRRSDYLHHGVADINYYIDCMLAIKRAVPDSIFFVFSDEPNCVEYIIKSSFMVEDLDKWSDSIKFVQSRTIVVDFALMSRCSAHIISNSTFSYWAALVSGSKRVLYPTPWSYAHIPSPHLIPTGWTNVSGVVSTFKRSALLQSSNIAL